MKAFLICTAWTGVLSCATLPLVAFAQEITRDLAKPVQQFVNIQSVAFSPDGNYLAAAKAGDKGGIVLWDLKTLKVHAVTEVAKGVPCVAFSPDSKTLAAGSNAEHCHLYATADAQLLRSLPGHNQSAPAVAFSSDGKTLAVGSNPDASIRLWNYQTGELLKTLTGHTKGILDLAFASDGTTLASSGNDYTILLWDAATGKRLRTMEQFRPYVSRRIAFDPKGQWLTGTSNSGSVKIVSLDDSKVLADFTDGGGSDWLAVAPSGKLLAVGRLGAKSVQIQFLDIRAPTVEEQKRILELIAKWDDDAYEVRESASQELRKLGLVAEPFLLKAMKESPSAETRMRAREARNAVRSPKSPVLLQGHSERILCAAFSPDGQILATGAQDGLVILWDMRTLQIKTKLSWPADSEPGN